jgi:branched-chain amino acid transport system ATP-binding protein
MTPPPLLAAEGLHAGYGAGLVLRGIHLALPAGACLGLLGRNGMGKTTLIRALIGALPARAGTVRIDGADVTAEPAFRRARRGIAVVPEGRGIFASLSVRENLDLAARPDASGAVPWPRARVLELFPRLAERLHHRGDRLSGGEQQMLAIGRALMTSPRLMILDEATEGLAPLVRAEIWRTLRRIRAGGMALIVVDRAVHEVLDVADTALVLVKGEAAFHGPPAALAADAAFMNAVLGV